MPQDCFVFKQDLTYCPLFSQARPDHHLPYLRRREGNQDAQGQLHEPVRVPHLHGALLDDAVPAD